jgi:tetratricopeptide (TPR) repeat protein
MINQPGKEILFAHLASNLLLSGDLDEAIKVCENGLKRFPTYAQAHYILARCYIRKKLNDEARAELERVLHYDPNHIKAIRDLAGLYFTNGFQDLYKDYLLKLFTLDPINENVIHEAKKLGEYKLWSTEPGPISPAQPAVQPEISSERNDERENVFIESEKENSEKTEVDPIFPDKIDLSQFDNVEDDFTTILHGKMEYSGHRSQNRQDTDADLVDIAKDIIEEPDAEEPDDSSKDQDQKVTTPGDSSAMAGNDRSGGVTGEPDSESTTQGINNSPEHSISPEKGDQKGSISDEAVSNLELADGDDSISEKYVQDEEEEKFEQPKIISQTLGEILVSQKKYVEAKAVFEALKEKQPENKSLDIKIEYLERIIGLEKEGKS